MRRGGENIQVEPIVTRILEGDEDAFRELIHTYRNYLYQVIYTIIRHPKDAEDLTQEVLIRIYFSLPQYQHKGLKTWMTRIAVNKAIDFKRSAQHKLVEVTASLDEWIPKAMGSHQALDTKLLRDETSELVQHRLDELPQGYQNVLIDFYMKHKTYQQIAEEQGISIKTVESKLYRAKQWARTHWKEEDFL
ncbi:ECF RNA polymerase sigma factor SigW [compost metagenome]